jgi:hypothetical protein
MPNVGGVGVMMKPVAQMTCEEIEDALAFHIENTIEAEIRDMERAQRLLAELKARRLAAGAG